MEYNNEDRIDEHEILDLSAKIEIILHGLRYAIFFKDLDILRKTAIDLQDCSTIINDVIEAEFGTE